MAFLCLDALRKTYPDGTDAVRGITMEIDLGEFIVFLGPSGCGKTTTLRMLAGLELPTSGRIFLNESEISSLPPSERDVGFVFQFYALYPHLTVAQNIGFPLENMGFNAVDRQKMVSEVSERVGISSLLNRHPGQLGGGDQQRVSLARAMVRRPIMYLMDEPLGTLDADRRLEMREFIREQQRTSGVTTIYVTHDQEEAMALADRIVVMRNGQIQQFDTPTEVYESPSDPFVAGFVGSPGMNLFEGEIARGETGLKLHSGGITLDEDHPSYPMQPSEKVTCGIRPEYLYLTDTGAIDGKVLLAENVGAFTSVYVDTAIGRLVMQVRADQSFTAGQVVRIGYRKEHLKIWNSQHAG